MKMMGSMVGPHPTVEAEPVTEHLALCQAQGTPTEGFVAISVLLHRKVPSPHCTHAHTQPGVEVMLGTSLDSASKSKLYPVPLWALVVHL